MLKSKIKSFIGGGTGDYCAFLKNKFPLFQVSLMDRVDERVKKALKKRNVKTKNCNFKENFTEGPTSISSWEVIEHIPVEQLHPFLINIRKALKPKGIYVPSTQTF